jgi:hypothetical protein
MTAKPLSVALECRIPCWSRPYVMAMIVAAHLGLKVDFQKVTRRITDAAVRVSAPMPPWRVEAMWATHNLIAHPVSEITHWLGFLHPAIRAWGLALHDVTVPPHAPNTGRG